MKIFGERLKQQALNLNISNAEAARRAGLGERRFNNYCNDEREPDLATLVKIAKALETTPNFLLGFGETPDQGTRARLLARINSAAQTLADNELDLVAVQLSALAARQEEPSASDL